MRIFWWSNAPWTSTGYGSQTRVNVPRIRGLGHEVVLGANHGLRGAMLNLGDGINIYPLGLERSGNDVLAAHAAHCKADVVITLYDSWAFRPNATSSIRWCPWAPVDHEPIPAPVRQALSVAWQPIAYSQFGVQQMMTVTAAVAVALGLASVGMPEARGPGVGATGEDWFVLSMVCFWFFIGGWATIVPCVGTVFLPRRLGPGVFFAVLYSVTLTLIVVLVIGGISGGSAPGEAYLALLAFAIGLMGTQLGVLSMFRCCGYRLQRVSRKPLPGDADVATDPGVPAASPFGDDFEAP